jgi:hypothetical protein
MLPPLTLGTQRVPRSLSLVCKLQPGRRHRTGHRTQALEHRIPSPPLTLDDALNVTGDPSSIIIAWLRSSAFAVNKAFPRTDVECDIASYRFKVSERLGIRPDAIADSVGSVYRAHERVVRGLSFVLTVRGPRSGGDGQADSVRRDVVCYIWRKMLAPGPPHEKTTVVGFGGECNGAVGADTSIWTAG